jgi:endonuclease/exonuclease/phosphatase family metal-dependent hydrolase
MPVVLLEHRETGRTVYFTNFHNPASTPRHPDQGRWRERALDLEVALVNRLQDRSRSPVILTGDLNSREPAFCALAEGAGMVASNGGGHDGSCRPPADAAIDWIFGSEGVRFTEHRRVESALVRRTTDHPMIVATVRLDPEGAAR